jgi:hypothetical protein
MTSRTHSSKLNEIVVYMYNFLDAENSYATFEKGLQTIVFIHRKHGQWFRIPFDVATKIELEDIRKMAVSAYDGMKYGYSAGWREGKQKLQNQLRDLLGIESDNDD